MTTKKIFDFLFMPYVPLLKMKFSYKVFFIPDLILSVIFTLTTLILNEIFDWGFTFSLKLTLLLIFQAFFSLLFIKVKPLDKNNLEAYNEFHFDKKTAIISFVLISLIITILLSLHLHLKSASTGMGM